MKLSSMDNRMFLRLLIKLIPSGAMFIVLLALSFSPLAAQSTIGTDMGIVSVNIARDAVILDPLVITFSVYPSMRGTSYYIDPRGSLSTMFRVRGEAAASFTIAFPLSATMYRTGGNNRSGMSNIITFTRDLVTINDQSVRSSSQDFLTAQTTSGSATLPGTLGQPGESYLYFWVGGTVTIPGNANTGTYTGDYIVTLSNYTI